MGTPMMPMEQQAGEQPWAFISELQRDFNVKEVEMTADKIPGRSPGAGGHSSARDH